jgi:23S rRNA (pseudouridine1915-N3)-methyltransferase
MRLTIICVGRSAGILQPAISDYESRARRYWSLDVVEVKAERAARGMPEAQVRDAEGDRIMKRVPRGAEMIALTRTGDAWNSASFARHLEERAVQAGADLAYIIGGAFGLSDTVTTAARRSMSLSSFTFPHDIARLILLEQLYRAGTILRSEPYHKGGDAT